MNSKPILPGSILGVLGGGQLGRMFAIAARKMGYQIHVYDPTPKCPAGSVCDREVNRPFNDLQALKEFCSKINVLTYEFENIPAHVLVEVAENVLLRPNPNVLHVCQNRRREKEFLSSSGFPVAPFRVVSSAAELTQAVEEIGIPCVLKTADFGYDGKGQQKITSSDGLDKIWARHGAPVGVLEGWINFEAELSVVVARRPAGEMKSFPVARNVHEHHILSVTTVPAEFDPSIEKNAIELAQGIAEALQVEGLLAVECFLTKSGQIIVNELAPRPHNSGHYTFDAAITSQFEQHVRAVCDLPLGETSIMKPVLMRNLLGDLWSQKNPPWDEVLKVKGLKLHLYGKEIPKVGRKMGHYCIIGDNIEEIQQRDLVAWRILTGN